MCFISLQLSILLFELSEGLADQSFSVIVNYAADLQEALLVIHDGKDIRLTLAISYMNFVLVFKFPFLFRKLGVPHLVLSYSLSEQNHLTCLEAQLLIFMLTLVGAKKFPCDCFHLLPVPRFRPQVFTGFAAMLAEYRYGFRL